MALAKCGSLETEILTGERNFDQRLDFGIWQGPKTLRVLVTFAMHRGRMQGERNAPAEIRGLSGDLHPAQATVCAAQRLQSAW